MEEVKMDEKTMVIDGDLLAVAIRNADKTKRAVAAEVGLSNNHVGLICKRGQHRVQIATAQGLAAALGLEVTDLQVGKKEEFGDCSELEKEMIRMYRALPGLEKIEALTQLKAIYSANCKHNS